MFHKSKEFSCKQTTKADFVIIVNVSSRTWSCVIDQVSRMKNLWTFYADLGIFFVCFLSEMSDFSHNLEILFRFSFRVNLLCHILLHHDSGQSDLSPQCCIVCADEIEFASSVLHWQKLVVAVCQPAVVERQCWCEVSSCVYFVHCDCLT